MEQRVFVQNFNNERTSGELKEIDDEEDSWDFEGMVTVKEVATSGIRRTF